MAQIIVAKEKPKQAEDLDGIRAFANTIRGKVNILYGPPGCGKSTLARELTKYFSRTYFFKIDDNYPEGFFDGLENVEKIEIENPENLINKLKWSLQNKDVKDALIVIDSITTLDAMLVEPRINPRVDIVRSRVADAAMLRLSKLKKRGATAIVIAHDAIKEFPKDKNQEPKRGPRMNRVAMRHADQIFEMSEDRQITLKMKREIVKKPKFSFVL